MTILYIILALLCAHYIADFALQSNYVAHAKQDYKSDDWIHALTAHSVHHVVAALIAMMLVVGYPNIALLWIVALVIGLSHWYIDYGKGHKLYGYHVDQFLHIAVILLCGTLVGLVEMTGVI